MAAAREAWPAEAATGIGGIAPERLVFLDECGVLTNMARLWGRSPRGTRAVGTVPGGRWRRLTILGALGIGGIVAAMAVEAAVTRRSSRRKIGSTMYAEPVARWQNLQWQIATRSGLPSVSYFTAPQTHPPSWTIMAVSSHRDAASPQDCPGDA